MSQWLFLIQKEGDQFWLPLESASSEILEGRYRLKAQIGIPELAVTVRMRHETTQDGILQGKTHRKVLKTDPDGTLSLLALDYLPPGAWTFACQTAGQAVAPTDVSEGTMPPRTLELQVLAQDCEPSWDLPESDAYQPLNFAASTTQPIMPPLSSNPLQDPGLAVATVPGSSSPAGFPNGGVRLPQIPTTVPQLDLETAPTAGLPPLLSHEAVTDTNLELQLPNFVPLTGMFPDLDEANASNYLQFLRRIAKQCDRHAAAEDFELLSWQQRFLSTLNTLAVTAHSVTDDSEDSRHSALPAPKQGGTATLLRPQPQMLNVAEFIAALETTDSGITPRPAEKDQANAALEHELPMLQLVIPTEALFVDQPMKVTVQISPAVAQHCVKIWISDRYTGEVLSPPWFLDKWETQDNISGLAAALYVVVPWGSQAVRFSATLLDPHTGQEGPTVTLDRFLGLNGSEPVDP